MLLDPTPEAEPKPVHISEDQYGVTFKALNLYKIEEVVEGEDAAGCYLYESNIPRLTLLKEGDTFIDFSDYEYYRTRKMDDTESTITSFEEAIITFVENAVVSNAEYDFISFVETINSGDLAATIVVYQGEPSEAVPSVFEVIADRGEYNIKYITSGGYPVFEYTAKDEDKAVRGPIVDEMIGAASAGTAGKGGLWGVTANTSDDCYPPTVENGRGDAVAIIDHFNIPGRPLSKEDYLSVSKSANDKFTNDPIYSYGAMFTPWCTYVLSGTYDGKSEMALPASFAYLKNLARSIQSNANYMAIAGIARGTVSYIKYDSSTDRYAVLTDKPLTNYIANSYCNDINDMNPFVSINPITRIRPYGEVIWGNRTLQKSSATDGVKAQGFLNIRNMLSDIKKRCFTVARDLMFEPNSDVLWANFKIRVQSLLEELKQGGGLVDYSIEKSLLSRKTKLGVVINIVPLYALETIDVLINITDEEVTVTDSTQA